VFEGSKTGRRGCERSYVKGIIACITDDSRRTDCIVVHKVMKNSGIKAGIKMASEYGGRDIKPTTNFSLGQTVYILRQVVSKASPVTVMGE
jgi:hypothetical protein